MKTISELYEKWNSLSVNSSGYILVSGNHPLSFHIGYDDAGRKTFVVLDTGMTEKLASSKAVNVENIMLGNNQLALKFSLEYASLDEIFVKLCWDLMSSSKWAERPLQALVEQYKKWQRLLQLQRDGILSKSVQKGLIGEMLFLQDRIMQYGDAIALNGWVGPEGSDQDFNFIKYWAEIKTTTIAGTEITISSIQQLDRFDLGYIVVYRMDSTVSRGLQTISLDEIVRETEKQISADELKNEFECRLARLGYQMRDSAKYKEHRYRLAGREIYEVTEDFPRLIKSNIPSEVIGARYDINLPSLEKYKRQEI